MILCHCRNITDDALKRAFLDARQEKPDEDVTPDDLVPDFGDFNCGGCRRIFERAAEQFNDSGDFNLFKRRKKNGPQSGLCEHAQNHVYKSDGIPDLTGSPIEGKPLEL